MNVFIALKGTVMFDFYSRFLRRFRVLSSILCSICSSICTKIVGGPKYSPLGPRFRELEV